MFKGFTKLGLALSLLVVLLLAFNACRDEYKKEPDPSPSAIINSPSASNRREEVVNKYENPGETSIAFEETIP